MKLVGLMPVRNEEWVLGLSARVALRWCDELILLVHASTDLTAYIARELVHEYPGRVWVGTDPSPKWDEMMHRQSMLEGARDRGATHIALVDADEVLTGNIVESVREWVETAAPVALPGYNLRGGIAQYHATGIWADRWFSVAFADDPRLHWTGDRFHHREPFGVDMGWQRPLPQGEGGVMHLWGANENRLVAKHALYKMTEAIRWPDKHKREIDRQYSLAFDPAADPRFDQSWRYAEVPPEWWEPYGQDMRHLDIDAEPWQATECRRLAREHPPSCFAGLDLYGVLAEEPCRT